MNIKKTVSLTVIFLAILIGLGTKVQTFQIENPDGVISQGTSVRFFDIGACISGSLNTVCWIGDPSNTILWSAEVWKK